MSLSAKPSLKVVREEEVAWATSDMGVGAAVMAGTELRTTQSVRALAAMKCMFLEMVRERDAWADCWIAEDDCGKESSLKLLLLLKRFWNWLLSDIEL